MILDYAKRIAVVFLFSVVLLLIMNGLTIAISGLEANETDPWPVMNDTLSLMVNNGYRL
ncbi:hypothetical protein HUG15_10710 [Salicibibacter cibarius]|uniref:Uncharacterized protein n=1 Tax=Salicibibacter cibarius TaxID=2743000 RepID=A0A7T7CBK9_9BACI|nr:hypothetical protein [Salicibibacter cibarius]QQK75980.1 hypothetical protein HUG15_10710 [Salicibibacter cibarius]